jgi:beta-glucosidase/6-phospho-beta-glucosidase/beta-galactosidase
VPPEFGVATAGRQCESFDPATPDVRDVWVRAGVPLLAYICWSITSNREWGLPFDAGSDFGPYHIGLDTDPHLRRTPTEASRIYAGIIRNWLSRSGAGAH